MDTLSAMAVLAVVLPLLGLVVCAIFWQRWKGPWPAKLLFCVGILLLLVPGTCFGIVALGEQTGLMHTHHF